MGAGPIESEASHPEKSSESRATPGQVGHVEFASHGGVDGAMFLGAVALRDQADLRDALVSRGRIDDSTYRLFDSGHGLIRS